MMGHKICFYGEIWLIIPVTLSYLEHWAESGNAASTDPAKAAHKKPAYVDLCCLLSSL